MQDTFTPEAKLSVEYIIQLYSNVKLYGSVLAFSPHVSRELGAPPWLGHEYVVDPKAVILLVFVRS